MKKLLYIATGLIVMTSCGKDKFESKPQIEIESYNTKELSPNSDLKISVKYTDKEGDLAKGDIFINIERLNVIPIPPGCQGCDAPDTLRYKIASFPLNPEGSILITLPYANQFFHLKEHPSINDTIRFKFAVTDLAGNKSDTAISDPIVILKQ
jgi:hypothetical protein